MATALDAAHSDDRQAGPRADLAHLGERDRADRRAGDAAGAATQPRLAGADLIGVGTESFRDPLAAARIAAELEGSPANAAPVAL